MKISEVIKELERLKTLHGDIECHTGGCEYEDKVRSIYFDQRDINAHYVQSLIKIR